MISLYTLSNEQKALSKLVMNERSLYPVTFRLNEANSSFTVSDSSRYVYKTITWTPPYDCGIFAVHFSASLTAVSSIIPIGVGLMISYASTPGFTATPTLENDGNVIYNYTGTVCTGGTSVFSFSDFMSYAPYSYYIPGTSSINLFFRVESIGLNTCSVLMSTTLHTRVMNQGA